MLLLHQIGSVKIGEVVRYTVTYTPSQDRILPSPERLHLRIRNTSAIALRAAFVHGPYNLCVAAYPASFDPNTKSPNPRRYGVPEFEPMVKAGGSWQCELIVPEHIRQSAGAGSHGHFGAGPERENESASWIIEVSSQIIFSTSAAVGFEIVLARDEKSLNLSSTLPVIGGQAQVPQPGKVSDHQHDPGHRDSHRHHVHHHAAQPKGVFSRAIRLKVEDTAALWNTPKLPGWDHGPRPNDHGSTARRTTSRQEPQLSPSTAAHGGSASRPSTAGTQPETKQDKKEKQEKQKKVHLVVLTHGLHSNLGADLLFMKESIDATVRQAKIDRKERKAKEQAASAATKRTNNKRKKKEAKLGKAKDPKDAKGTFDSNRAKTNASDAGDGTDGNTSTSGSPLTREVTTGDTDEGQDVSSEHGKGKEVENKASSEEEDGDTDEGEEDVGDEEDDDDDDDEEVIVRGFSGNATRTERGIKFLGKRLARYVLSTCYPDQPYLPSMKGAPEPTLRPTHDLDGKPIHKHSTVHRAESDTRRPVKVTSISFIGHSLGGLVQTYAIAYVQKHSPQFFDLIRPVNFVTLATPFLGLSNENPRYVKFALDFGLVGRTGKDLGLTWRAPTIARSGWGAIVSNLGESAHKKVIGESRPESKPLLRILPTGPAHTALRKFRNRTIYSNVVNDGIVPLRTSCLLFLDWQGLGRVEKARRDASLVETLVGAGWAELTGTNLIGARRDASRRLPPEEDEDGSGTATPTAPQNATEVPQPSANAIVEDDKASLRSVPAAYGEDGPSSEGHEPLNTGPLAGLFAFFRGNETHQAPTSPSSLSPKQNKIYQRSQTIKFDDASTSTSQSSGVSKVTTGQEFEHDLDGLNAPPRTTFFESAHDLINPTLPSTEYLIDPSKRPRTIFHDRVYHPADIPPPPLKAKNTTTNLVIRRRNTSLSSAATSAAASTGTAAAAESREHASSVSSSASSPYSNQPPGREDSGISAKDYDDTVHTSPDKDEEQEVDGSQMRVEEKIARAYHRGIAWRKVLVKLEPDAHNNIIVRRMFSNAFGWPVVKHLVDAHFSDSATARMRVDEEGCEERALDIGQPPDQFGGEIKRAGMKNGTEVTTKSPHKETASRRVMEREKKNKDEERRSSSLAREAEDKVTDLPHLSPRSGSRGGDGGGGGISPVGEDSPTSPTPTTTSALHNPRQHVFRADSVTWSDGDWIDTDGESEAGTDLGDRSPRPTTPDVSGSASGVKGNGQEVPTLKVPRRPGNSSPLLGVGHAAHSSGLGGSWNWTEKIVGKGGASRAASTSASASASVSASGSILDAADDKVPSQPKVDSSQDEELSVD